MLEAKQWAPSWRRMAKCLLRNDYWCKSLGQAQPKSDAWREYLVIKAAKKQRQVEPVPVLTAVESDGTNLVSLFDVAELTA